MTEYKKLALSLARQAGDIMKANFELGMKKEWKEDKSPLTVTDLQINDLVINQIKERFSEHDILAEERSSISGKSEYVWVCDPIDGTIMFSHGIPICTFSLALTKGGESILGVAYDPFSDRLFTAEKGQGAFLNDKKISVSTESRLDKVVGEYEMFKRAKYNINRLTEHLNMVEEVKLMHFCSIVYPSCLIATGDVGFTIFPHTTAHDMAAVKIIVEEAGGKVTDLFGQEQRYDQAINGCLVSNGVLHNKLIELVNQYVNKISIMDSHDLDDILING